MIMSEVSAPVKAMAKSAAPEVEEVAPSRVVQGMRYVKRATHVAAALRRAGSSRR